MAENWIKVRKSLRSDMRIIGHARRMGVSLNEFYGAMIAFFCWADEHTADGELPGFAPADLDDALISGLPGFGDQLEKIGWISVNDDGLFIQNFDDHMSKSAKKRAQSAKRNAALRSRDARSVTEASPDKIRRDKRREDKRGETPPIPPAFDWSTAPAGLNTPEVRAAFDEFEAYRAERRLAKWKPRTIKTKLAEFAGRPDDFIEAVRVSIGNGWQGIFEGKAKRPAQSHAQRAESYNHPEDNPLGGVA